MSQFNLTPVGPPRGDSMALLAQLASQMMAGRDRNLLAGSEALGGGLQNLGAQKMQASELVARIRAAQQQQQSEQMSRMLQSGMANATSLYEGAQDRKSREKIAGEQAAAMRSRTAASEDPLKAELTSYLQTGEAGPMLTRAAANAGQDIPTYADTLLSGRSAGERNTTNSVDDYVASLADEYSKVRRDQNSTPEQKLAAKQRFDAEFQAAKPSMTKTARKELEALSGVWTEADSSTAASPAVPTQRFWPRIGAGISDAATGLVDSLSGVKTSPGPGIVGDPTMQDTLRSMGIGPVSGFSKEGEKMDLLRSLRAGGKRPTLDMSYPRDTLGATGLQLPSSRPAGDQFMQSLQQQSNDEQRARLMMQMLGLL